MKSFIIPIFSILILLMLGGCQSIETRGQFIDNTLLSQLETRRPHKSEVMELIGSPTIIPDYSPNTWYYIERTMSKRAWFDPQVVQQRIVKITFNNNNLLQEVIVINDSHKEDVEVIREYTKTYGTELNGLQKFVKNFGRFNATTKGSKKKK